MYIDNNIVVIQTLDEVNAVFYAPVDAQRSEGSDPAFYAAFRFMEVEYDQACRMGYRFELPALAQYWEKLKEAPGNRKLIDFNFNTGLNGSRSWYGEDTDCELRDNASPEIQAYNKVAQEIARQGFHSFKFYLMDNWVRVCRTISVKHIASDAVFVFDDLIDPNLYDNLREWIDQQTKKTAASVIAANAKTFLQQARSVR